MIIAPDSSPSRHERLAQRFDFLQSRHGYVLLDAESFDNFAAQTGLALVLFADDPAKVPETFDLTVILPEVTATLHNPVRVGILGPEAARKVATRYGILVWPALLALSDGAYLGTIEGLKDWGAYTRLVPELLAASASRPPSIGIPVINATGSSHATCH